MDMRFLDKG